MARTLKDAIEAAKPYKAKLASGELKPVPPPIMAHPAPPLEPVSGGLSNFLKCPLPGIAVAPDSLRQFYRTGMRQFRIITAAPLSSK